MGKFAKLHALIKERCTEPGAYYFPDPWWKKEVDAITDDLDTAIEFVRSECIDEELYWLAEVFDDIMERTKSAAFLDCLRQRVQSVENPEWKRSILEDIRTAAEYIDG
ncbi:MAG: hypothetical protein E7331_08155 [Clostridiales bacterium]|nr:hypothetical protein [Clostridiales bacterium]